MNELYGVPKECSYLQSYNYKFSYSRKLNIKKPIHFFDWIHIRQNSDKCNK